MEDLQSAVPGMEGSNAIGGHYLDYPVDDGFKV
jgi:hypothetical protein